MKRYLVSAVAVLLMFGGYKAFADGNYAGNTPGPVISATGQNYSYPAAQAPAPGGILVQNGSNGTLFNWSNTVVTTTTSLTTNQFPSLPLLTLAQIQALAPSTTGQIAMCTNCTQSFVCVSTGSANAGQWAVVSGTTSLGGAAGACR